MYSQMKWWIELSLEEITKTLTNLGLTRLDAEVYIYNAIHGPLIIDDFEMALKYSLDQIYNSLKTLTTKRLIIQKGTIFSAIPFEEALELLINLEKEQSQFWVKVKVVLGNIEKRDECVSINWQHFSLLIKSKISILFGIIRLETNLLILFLDLFFSIQISLTKLKKMLNHVDNGQNNGQTSLLTTKIGSLSYFMGFVSFF